MATEPLTEAQTAFAAEYAATPVMDVAAKRAGVHANTARKSLASAKVQDAIAILRMHATTGISDALTKDYVVGQLVEIMERSMQKAPVMKGTGVKRYQAKDAQGNPVWRYDAASALKAAELLGRVIGMWNDKLEVEHTLSDAAQKWLGRDAADRARVIEGEVVREG